MIISASACVALTGSFFSIVLFTAIAFSSSLLCSLILIVGILVLTV